MYRIRKDGNFVYTNSLSPPPPPPFSFPSNDHNEKSPTKQSLSLSNASPVLVLVIIILAVVFFIAGLFHLLVRFLMKRPSRSSPMFQSNRFQESSHSHVLQRQLRQLFRLQDSGLDQGVIDALPVFCYKDIAGIEQPFDCPVCLCEFSEQDELRLLPACSHAFHVYCIDTWLLSNSSCPLCRRTLLISDLFVDNPMHNFEDHVETPRGFSAEGELRQSSNLIFSVRLGKFKSSNSSAGETSKCNLDARRCYSMGTFQYVVGESDLQVTLCPEIAKHSEAKLVKESAHSGKIPISGELEGKKIRRQKGESFSVSKIWLWSKNSRLPGCSDTDIHVPTSVSVSSPVNNQTQECINGTS